MSCNKLKIIAFCLLLFAFCLLLSSCGRKALPVPPGTVRPNAVKDLSYNITPHGIELIWSVPVRNRDGSPLDRIKGFRLYKAEVPIEESCEACPPPFGKPIDIPFEAKPEEARKMVYEDRTVHSEMRYKYMVSTVKGWLNVSDPSNQISLTWHVPPSQPAGFMARSVEHGILLSWQSPSKWANNKPMDKKLLFRIYRARTGTDKWKALPDLLDSMEYLDLRAKKARYHYKVAAVLLYYDTEIEGLKSPETEEQPGNFVMPEPPGGVVAVQSTDGTMVLWREDTGSDLSGYIVYRKGPDGLINRLNNRPIRMSGFLDRAILPRGLYTYWVTTVDRADPPNESPPSDTAEVEIIRRRLDSP